MKRSISLILALLIVMTSAFTSALAVNYEEYDLFIGGIRVNSDNRDNVLGDGSISYDNVNNILYLNGAHIKTCSVIETITDTPYPKFVTGAYIYYSGTDSLEIKISGENEIVANRSGLASFTNAVPDGISSQNSNVTLSFTGNGSLKISGTSETDLCDGIFANGSISVKGPTLDINSSKRGIHCVYGGLTIEESETDVKINSEIGIRVPRGKIVISDSKLSVINTKNAIFTTTGDVEILGTYTNIYLAGGDRAVYSDTGSDLPSGKVTINTKGKITIENANFGISAGSVFVKDGVLDFNVRNKGIYSSEGNIVISGGDIHITGSEKNPMLSREDIEIIGGHLKTECFWGLWANGRISVLGGFIEIKAEEDGLLQTAKKENIVISGGTLILETKKGNAFSYMEGQNYPVQVPDLSGYEDVVIDYGTSPEDAKKGQTLENAVRDEFWNCFYVVIRPRKEHDTVEIIIDGSDYYESEESEVNPDTGAPVLY